MSIRLLTSFVAAVLGGVGCADVHAQELDARIRCRVLTQACLTTSSRI